jgi:hypothetical protein
MNKKQLTVLPLALLIIALFVGSFVYYRFNSEVVSNSIRTAISKVSGTNPNKNLGDSKFVATAATIDSLDNCNIDIKLNDSKLEIVPGAANNNPNVRRFTYKSKETLTVNEEQKVGSVDVACVGFENTMKQLISTISTANQQDPNKITQIFGVSYGQLTKLENQELYRLFLLKRGQPGECSESEKISEVGAISSDLEKRLNKKFIDCTYKYKDNEGVENKIIKYKYLLDKDSKFILNLGESDADTLKIQDQFLLINKI